MSESLVVVLLLVSVAELFNSFMDAPNAIATVVSTRVLSPLRAVAMAALLNVAGCWLPALPWLSPSAKASSNRI
jgi:PiT family inorganic phosphate transporter